MAQLLRDAIDAGVPPSMARLLRTPEQVAASYDQETDHSSGGRQGDQEPARQKV